MYHPILFFLFSILATMFAYIPLILRKLLNSCGELSAEDLFVPTKKVLAANSGGKNLASVSQDENDHHSRILRQSYAAERSQLNVIFDILGTPSEEDLSYLDQETAKAIRSMPRKSGLVICFFFSFLFSCRRDLLTDCHVVFTATRKHFHSLWTGCIGFIKTNVAI